MNVSASSALSKPEIFSFSFERNFDKRLISVWLLNNWTMSFYFSVVYVIFITAGREYMKTRERFQLNKLLLLWNLSLAIFSLFGALRAGSEFLFMLTEYGFYHSVCQQQMGDHYQIFRFWAWYFAWSKVMELGDTVFIVLRKQPLIFLHWYHHITVMVYVWFSVAHEAASGRWFLNVNYTIHTFMYSYFALKSVKVRIPRFISMAITAMQLVQMVIGLYVNWHVYQYIKRGENCNVSYSNVIASVVMYFSYFILFVRFFYDAYLGKRAIRHKQLCQKGIKKHD